MGEWTAWRVPRKEGPLTSRLAEYEQQSLYTTVPQFYDFLQNRVLVQFKPRHEENPGRTQDFDLMLSKKMTYDVVRPFCLLRINVSLTHRPHRSRMMYFAY